MTKRLGVPNAGVEQLDDPAGKGGIFADELTGFADPHIPAHPEAVACLVIPCLDWIVALILELIVDMALVALDAQQQVDPLLGAELSNESEA
ncbi:hypothetical protein [Synechococcus sp. BA-132 BA5]|uniref:hypothetical protein n=1 Tax=Synechococcus sp. BA-132 BA5 TaxID=3110252 RepID=UPI002B21A2EA|nr:hypothetical protein [Synechococcus sp. BA-132 BA5]MEA5415399.1 hypothetical protein [Synechococcus sp. BA-132 BA5]